jgi:mannose-6-phosphate isomerase-like protein (cupin superfamily)
MKRAHLEFGKGFKVSIGNGRSQSAQMVLTNGGIEGGAENRHGWADQWLFVVSGTGSVIVDGRRIALKRGSLVLIERGERHQVRAGRRSRLKTLNIYVPPAYTTLGDELPASSRKSGRSTRRR